MSRNVLIGLAVLGGTTALGYYLLRKRAEEAPPEAPWTCGICGATFGTEAGLRAHLIGHAPKTQKYRCNDCGNVFDFTPPWGVTIRDRTGGIVVAPLAPSCPACGSSDVSLTPVPIRITLKDSGATVLLYPSEAPIRVTVKR